MKQKFRYIIYDMRHQPVISWVTFAATVLTIFLIMVVVLMERVKFVPFAPESCRERLLVGRYMHVESIDDGRESSSSSLSYESARTLYDNLDGVERISYMCTSAGSFEIMDSESGSFNIHGRIADAEFFNIFDHTLVQGRYFTPEEADAGQRLVVLAESVARRALGNREWIGAQIMVNHEYYNVIGIVKDNSSLATLGSGEIFIPLSPGDPSNRYSTVGLGRLSVILLVKDGVDLESVRAQVEARYAILDAQLAPEGYRTVYHGAPFDIETIACGVEGSNITPDKNAGRKKRLILFAILLIVPAINLGSMLHSRMQHRVGELGVRRAFGCTRRRIMADIIVENFIITLAGGIVGVALGILFAKFYSGLYEDVDTYGLANHTPALSAVLNWGTVFISIAFCFLLNIISASVPAWQAARLNPVNAINSK